MENKYIVEIENGDAGVVVLQRTPENPNGLLIPLTNEIYKREKEVNVDSLLFTESEIKKHNPTLFGTYSFEYSEDLFYIKLLNHDKGYLRYGVDTNEPFFGYKHQATRFTISAVERLSESNQLFLLSCLESTKEKKEQW